MEDASSGGGDALDPDEVKSVQSQLGFIDVVGYDACNMAQIEIMSLWHGRATALVGSQEFVNMDGIEYDTVLSQLNANPNMTADQVASASSASAIVEKTYSSMAVDDRYLALRAAVNDWSIALRNALPAQKTAITRGFSNAKSFWQAPTDKDLYDLAKQINAQVTDNALKTKGTAVMNAVDAVVLHRRFTGKAYNMVHGITITGITRPVERRCRLDVLPHARFRPFDGLGRIRGPTGFVAEFQHPRPRGHGKRLSPARAPASYCRSSCPRSSWAQVRP